MVEAAYRCFAADGYAGTTMAVIAADAGVAVQTLYYTFHTKAALLGEALGAAIVGFDRWREPPADPDLAGLLTWHEWWDELAAAATARQALEVFIAAGVPILDRVAPLVPAMQATAGDRDAAEVMRLADERRFLSHREVVRLVATKPPGLRPELDEEMATDILLTLFSPEVATGLARRGWNEERRLAFFGELIPGQLLGEG